jgi:hypothetical protein
MMKKLNSLDCGQNRRVGKRLPPERTGGSSVMKKVAVAAAVGFAAGLLVALTPRRAL